MLAQIQQQESLRKTLKKLMKMPRYSCHLYYTLLLSSHTITSNHILSAIVRKKIVKVAQNHSKPLAIICHNTVSINRCQSLSMCLHWFPCTSMHFNGTLIHINMNFIYFNLFESHYMDLIDHNLDCRQLSYVVI